MFSSPWSTTNCCCLYTGVVIKSRKAISSFHLFSGKNKKSTQLPTPVSILITVQFVPKTLEHVMPVLSTVKCLGAPRMAGDTLLPHS